MPPKKNRVLVVILCNTSNNLLANATIVPYALKILKSISESKFYYSLNSYSNVKFFYNSILGHVFTVDVPYNFSERMKLSTN